MIAGGALQPKLMLWKPKSCGWIVLLTFTRFSYPDSIRYYVDKCHEIGITYLVLDIKDNTGEVLILVNTPQQFFKEIGRISTVLISIL
ncbi:hypothetical protein NXX38_16970 [Bacteroides sp. BFG-637]|uniref:hypothetical protein n=1 Tax=Bacteroides sp. BFG-637 TaxID=2972764 RepID=UPI002165706F|nr:hypothetical protein [Bacteroides sp. BFG-637]MCS3313493.1 hypothetical protein [Bacteroides sp. BFG-637]